jgi:glycine/D-amino acid oxidase-like deaminating enzyme
MINKADVIVIGSGGLGAATAYYLSQRKRLSVALIDKHDIGSQTHREGQQEIPGHARMGVRRVCLSGGKRLHFCRTGTDNRGS